MTATHLNHARLRYDRVHLHGIDKRFTEGDVLDTRVVEPVDVVPEVDLLLLVIRVFYRSDVQRGVVGKYQAVLLQVLVAGEKDGVEHGLVKEEVTHPLGDDDVEFFVWERCIFKLALDESNACEHDKLRI